MHIDYQRETIDADEFVANLQRSGLGARRPVDDLPRLQRMLDGANLIVTARAPASEQLVGIARSITDWSYACYLSDLAVDVMHQGLGIGKQLIDLTRKSAGEESMCLLIAAPDAEAFYHKIGMPTTNRAFVYPRSR